MNPKPRTIEDLLKVLTYFENLDQATHHPSLPNEIKHYQQHIRLQCFEALQKTGLQGHYVTDSIALYSLKVKEHHDKPQEETQSEKEYWERFR